MDPALVLFAIQAGVRLGRKIHDVLIDGTVERALVLPVGNLFGAIAFADARDFFDRKENRSLVGPGGPYRDLDDDALVLAYRTILLIDSRLAEPGEKRSGAVEIVSRLHEFEQFKKGFGARPPLQRLLGTVVEIGIDYFVANPNALGRDSSASRLVASFVAGLDATDFAEGTREVIVADLFTATLRTLGDNLSLVDDDRRVQALVGGITKALLVDVGAIKSVAGQIRREELFRRIGSSILRGGVGALTENLDVFVPEEAKGRAWVQTALTTFFAGIRDQEDLFTNESLELAFKSTLRAVAENPKLFTRNQVLQELLSRTVGVLTDSVGSRIFSAETAGAIVIEALDVARENMETLLDPDRPEEQLLATSLSAMAQSLSQSLAGGGGIAELLSKAQLVELVKVVFGEVAKHPEQVLGGDASDPRKTVLAQVIASVASALGKDPTRFVTGAGFVELVRLALGAAVANSDKLIDLQSADPKTNLLQRVLVEVVRGILANGDARGLVSRDVFLEIVRRILPVASANAGVLLEDSSPRVKDTILIALSLAEGTLAGRINGRNLPALIAGLLTAVLWEELHLDEPLAVAKLAREILRSAAA